jgi:hypothetical protein
MFPPRDDHVIKLVFAGLILGNIAKFIKENRYTYEFMHINGD